MTHHRHPITFLFLALCLYLLATRSPVSNSNSDPELTLVVSQAVLEHGTIYLDEYQDRLALSRDFAGFRASNTILEQNGHYLNYFPLGPSLIAMPFVAAAHRLGYDMTVYKDNDALQNLLSGLTVVAVFGLLVLLARCYLSERVSLVLALVFVLGTNFISTLGTAFWTHNLSVPLFLLVLWLLARHEMGNSATIHPYLIGLLLFLAYICRASAAAFILPLFLYLLLRLPHPAAPLRLNEFWKPVRSAQARDLLKVAFTSALCLALYFLAWRLAAGQWFPVYFSVSRLQVERTAPFTALAGLLLSPGRGLFVYSPFLLLVFLVTLRLVHPLKHYRLLLLVAIWLGLHLFIVVRAASWWGGASYGPRLLVDVLPAWFLLAVWGWREGWGGVRPRAQPILLLLTMPLIIWSVYLHSYQGLFNQHLSQWEIEMRPQPDLQEYFDWHYPPFRASPALFCQRDTVLLAQWLQQNDATSHSYRWGRILQPQQAINLLPSTPAVPTPVPLPLAYTVYLPLLAQHTGLFLTGWTPPDDGFSWSKCPQASVYVPLGTVDAAQTYQLIWQGATLGEQTMTLYINHEPLETFTWNVAPDAPAERIWLIPGSLLRSNQLNAITFDLPQAHPPHKLDNRPLALAFFTLRLEPAALQR